MSDMTNSDIKRFIERIERLNEEKKALTADIAEIFKEAKSSGHDVKIMRKVIAERKLDEAERLERDALVASMLTALGDYSSSPLAQAALSKVA